MTPRSLTLLLLSLFVLGDFAEPPLNVLLVLFDNARPQFKMYGDGMAITPYIDSLALNSTVFSNANCQISWCAPSRNSFLSGRRPDVTQSWNFLDSFREVGPSWVTLPG